MTNIITQPKSTELVTCKKTHQTVVSGTSFVKRMQGDTLPSHWGVTPEDFFKGTVLMSRIDEIKKISGYQRWCPGLEEILYQLEKKMDLTGKIPKFKVVETTDNGWGDRRNRDQDYEYIQLSLYNGYTPCKWLCIKK